MRKLFAAALILFTTAIATAEPPKLIIPAEIKADVGAWVVVSPDTTAKAITYVGLDGLSAFPSSELKDQRKLVVNPPRVGTYRFVAVGTLNDEQATATFAVVVGGGGTPPVDPPTQPPTIPRPATAYFFMAVRADGPAQPGFTRIMQDPAWGELRKRGHQVKDKTVTELNAWGYKLPATVALPAILTFVVEGDRSREVHGPLLLPTTSAGILALPEIVK